MPSLAPQRAKIFGRYDIRQKVNDTFNTKTYRELAFAWAKTLAEQGEEHPRLVVGHDARVHSSELFEAFIEGLVDAGIEVWDIGLCPTPLVYFAEFAHQFNENYPEFTGCCIVTASHNPAEYNGLKMTYHAKPVPDELFSRFEHHYMTLCEEETVMVEHPGKQFIRRDMADIYLEWMETHFGKALIPFNREPLKVVVDCGNGTGGILGPALYKQLGCEVIPLFEEPDGRFPNHHPDPLVRENLRFLTEKVKESGADLGIAFDGDSDRIGVVDEHGTMISQDQVYMLVIEPLLQPALPEAERPKFITEVKMSEVTHDWIRANGGNPIMVKTGHVFSKQGLEEHQAIFAGELSGHHCFKDRYFGFDDAFYCGARLIEILAHSSKKLSEKVAGLPASFMSDEIRIHCDKEKQASILQHIRTQLETFPKLFGPAITDTNSLDGLRMRFEGGFILIRSSNTEPCFTLRWEAKDQSIFEQLNQKLIPTIEALL